MAGEQPLSDRWIRAVLRHHRLILLVAVVVTALSGWIATKLDVNADLRALLPEDHPVVAGLEKVEDSFGSTNSVNFIAKDGTAEARHAFTDALAEALEGHELLRDVEHGLNSDFFSERALYYLSEAELDELEQRVEAWNHYEVCTHAPENCAGEPDKKAPDRLRSYIEDKREQAYALTGFHERFEREGIEAEVLLAYPKESPSRLEVAHDIAIAMREVAEEVFDRDDQPWSDTDMTYNVLGSYITKADEHVTVTRDMAKSGAFGTIGVLAVLYVLFRSTRAVLVLLVPLSCGVVWSLAATQITLGRLNTMTATISTVVMGIGIDAGIHFYSRMKRHREDHDDGEAIRLAFRGLVVPLLIASSTTMVAFASMASSAFPAFHEFGIIAALGIALCLLAMVTVLPALTFLVGIKEPKTSTRPGLLDLFSRGFLARPGTLLLLLVVVSAVGFTGAREVGFEYNVRELQSSQARRNTEADAEMISKIFGKDIHAAVLVLDDLEAVRTTITEARAKHEKALADGDSVVAELLAVTDLMPDPKVDMEERAERIDELQFEYEDLIAKLHERAERPPEKGEEQISKQDVELLDAMLSAKPFTETELPSSLLSKLRARDGRWAIYAYPAFDAADMREGLVFMNELEGYVPEGDSDRFVGEAVLYASMFVALDEEAPMVLGMATILIAALVLWQLRSVTWTLMTLLPLALSLYWLLAIMGWIDLRFTLFNLPIVPAILGIGVDNGVYLSAAIRRQERTEEGLASAVKETGDAILAATATTAVGFAAFMVADSGGMRGIGALAVLGIVMAALSALLVLPTIANVAQRRKTP